MGKLLLVFLMIAIGLGVWVTVDPGARPAITRVWNSIATATGDIDAASLWTPIGRAFSEFRGILSRRCGLPERYKSTFRAFKFNPKLQRGRWSQPARAVTALQVERAADNSTPPAAAGCNIPSMSTTDEIKSRIDIVELITASGVRLRKSGRNYSGFCPFHPNKHTPAFVVWPETGTWRCFGQCNEGGDIFKFVMKKEGLDFQEALDAAGDPRGVQLPRCTRRRRPDQKEAYEHLRSCWRMRCISIGDQLRQNAGVLAYLRENAGLTDATIETFGLGYAPQGWVRPCAQALHAKAVTPEQEMLEAGLLTGERQSDSQSGTRTGCDLRPLPQPHHDPDPGRKRPDGGLRRAHRRPGRHPQVPQLPRDPAFHQGPPALRTGSGPQAHPHGRPGGDRGGLPGCDRPAPGRL